MAKTITRGLEVKEPKFPMNIPTFTIGGTYNGCVDLKEGKPVIKARDEQGNTITCDPHGKPADPFVKDLAAKGKIRPEIAELLKTVGVHAEQILSSEIVTTWLKEQKKTPLLD
jgi:hypothetical protein